MKILIDMNLSPDWVKVLKAQGWEPLHWSSVGDIRATDQTIFNWARENGYVVFTHDLDFGAILAATNADAPSVFQIRVQDVFPQAISKRVIQVFKEYASTLEGGALVTLDVNKSRMRILPLRKIS
jgi:predicted nuclease of predicted toxin-antitoxin system